MLVQVLGSDIIGDRRTVVDLLVDRAFLAVVTTPRPAIEPAAVRSSAVATAGVTTPGVTAALGRARIATPGATGAVTARATITPASPAARTSGTPRRATAASTAITRSSCISHDAILS